MGGCLTTKIWHYKDGDRVRAIILRHNTKTKSKRVFVDRTCVADLSDEKFDHESNVPLPGGYVAELKVKTEGMVFISYTYTLRIGPHIVPSFEDIKTKSDHGDIRFRARVKAVERGAAKGVVGFIIEAWSAHEGEENEDEDNGCEMWSINTERTLSDFEELHMHILSSFAGQKNASVERLNTQALIGLRRSDVDTEANQDQLRRRADSYINCVLELPGASYHPDVLAFFGVEQPSRLPEYASSKHVALDFSAVSPLDE